MVVKVELDDWAKRNLKNRLGVKTLSQGANSLSVPELLIYSLLMKKDGDTMDLTEEAGKLDKLLKNHE